MMEYGIWRNGLLQRRLSTGNPFVVDENQYPPNWLDFAPVPALRTLNIYPIVMSGSPGDVRFYTTTEGAPSFANFTITIPWINALRPVAEIRTTKMVLLAAQAQSVMASGVTVGGKTYPMDSASRASARLAIQDVLGGLTNTSFISDINGGVTVISSSNATQARNALVTYAAKMSEKWLAYTDSISSLAASGDAAGIVSLDLTQGWPS